MRAQRASSASKTPRKTKGRNCAQLFAIARVSARSRAQLCTIAHICTDCARCAVAACASARARGAPRYCIHMDMAGSWTSRLQALENIMSEKLGCRPWTSSVSNKRIHNSVVVGKRAQLGTIALICARLLALVLKGPLNRPHYRGSEYPNVYLLKGDCIAFGKKQRYPKKV